MSVEKKIIDNSKEKLKDLMPRATKAMQAPDTGVKILVKGAYYVIRDCAKITVDYLPIHLYTLYEDPIKSLSGKFTKKEIESFVEKAQNVRVTRILCNEMLIDARKNSQSIKPLEISEPVGIEYDDVYGEYGSDDIIVEKEFNFDLDDTKAIIELLCTGFNVK